ncbi:RHS repeat-associated core domain-containing protein [Kribbella ginsengisoli]|uniref:RHS repeat-associated core domain-containing protein n=1 Tax=Kribbella ginsengisoli TaxID=363865 RepID=UPI0031D4DBFC
MRSFALPKFLAIVLSAALLTAGLVKVTPTASAAASPTLTVAGVALAGSTQPATFKADLTDAPAATGEVTWLVDDKFAAKTPTPPHSYSATYTAGPHKLKARWVIDTTTGATAETFANFTVGTTPTQPTLMAGSEPLQGATVNSPFRADLAGVPTSIPGGVTFLLDGALVIKDTSSPFQANITTIAGSHQVRATWTDPSNQQAKEVVASANVQDGPFLSSAGTPLHAGKVNSPFTAVLSNPVGVSGDVTWLLDDSFIGKSTAPPHQFTVTTTNGQHKLKARWVINTGTGATKDVTAVFTVGTMPDFRVAPPVDEEPGPAIKNLWATSDNRRTPIAGVYDWSHAGFGGGTPLPAPSNYRSDAACNLTAATVQSTYNVIPNDDKDDTNALQAVIDHIRTDCSPTSRIDSMAKVMLPAGKINLSHELHIDADYMLLRGAGSGTGGTQLVFAPDANTRYDKITKDGSRWDLDAMTSGEATGGWIWPGRGMIRVQSRAVAPKYAEQYAAAAPNRKDLFEGTVNDHWTTGLLLGGKAGDANYSARKGDKVIQLAPGTPFDNLKVGGFVNVMAANSKKFYDSMEATPTEFPLDNLHMRQQMFMVTSGDPLAGTLTLDKPLEYDLPVNSTSDGSAPLNGEVFPSKVSPMVDLVTGVGIEDLAFTQVMPGLDKESAKHNYGNMDPAAAMHGIVLKWVNNSWIRNVHSEMTGSHPIVTEAAANISVIDNKLEGSWNKGKGGNGYFRGSRVWDSVYAGNTTRDLRHFTFQWSSSGNVAIANSFDSDLNLHGGFERNNLFELNEVTVPYEHKSSNCQSNCGDEGGSDPDDSDWYPIWWAAGKKAVKWSGSSGENNVFHNNHLRKQLGDETQQFTDYQLYSDRSKLYRFGSDGGEFKHLTADGTAISDWAHMEERDYTGHNGVDASKSDGARSIFLKSISQSGYGGPNPQPLRRTWGCSCWDGRGMVNTRLAADPVNTATGSLTEYFTDLAVAGPGRSLTGTRTYNSLDDHVGSFGKGWTFGYDVSLTQNADNSLDIRNGTGGVTKYTKSGTAYVTPDPGVTATLTDKSGGGWVLTNIAGDKMTFNAAGQLIADRDPQGRGVSLTYSGGKLATITDDLTQTFTIEWNGALISKITASTGDVTEYGYTGGQLTSVKGIDGKTTTYGYDATVGLLNSITDPTGAVSARTTYDPTTKRAISQIDEAGGTWTFAWDAASETATITDPAGVKTQDIYQGNVLVSHVGGDGRSEDLYYGSNNHVTATTSPGQELTRSEYDTRGNLLKQYLPTGTTDAAGAFEQWTYDAGNRVTSYKDAAGNETTYEYDSSGQLLKTTYPDASTTSQTYTALGQVATSTDQLGKVTTFTYNAKGDPIKVTSPGGAVVTSTFDAKHQRLSQTNPLGNVPGATPEVVEQNTEHWTYDSFGQVLTHTDQLDRVTTNTYDALGQILTTTDPAGGVTKYEYNASGQVTKTTDPEGRVTTSEYDDAGRLISTTAPGGAKTTNTYDAVTGDLSSTTGPEGNVAGADAATREKYTARFTYDAEGQLTHTLVSDPNNPAKKLATVTTYDDQGRPVQVTNADMSTTSTTYDVLGRVVETTDPTGLKASQTYDKLGRVVTSTSAGTTTTFTFDKAGQQTRVESQSGRATVTSYDADGQVSSTMDPLGKITSYEYDANGRQTKSTDPLGRSAVTTYDPAGQVSSVTDPAGGKVDYTYDALGQLKSVTTPTGAVTAYDYDKAGNLTKTTTPRNGAYVNTYDAAGRLATNTTPTGRETRMAYTPSGALASTTLPAGSVSYTYDNLGHTTKVDYSDSTPDVTSTYDAAGRPKTVTAGAASTAYSYDKAGRLTGLTRGSAAFAYGHDTQGRLSKRTYPDGRSQAFTYDTDGLVATATLSGGSISTPIATTYTYDTAGHLKKTDAGGLVTDRTYDAAGQLTKIEHGRSGTALMSQTVAYDAAGRPTTIDTTRGATVKRSLYGYDTAGQLTSFCTPSAVATTCDGAPGSQYTYDSSGNRKTTTKVTPGQADVVTATVVDADDRIQTETTGASVTTSTYDANGYLKNRGSPTGTEAFTYRLDGNLAQTTTTAGTVIDYTYDEAGNRLTSTADGALQFKWTWDTSGALPIRTTEANAAGTATHQWANDPVSGLGGAYIDTVGTTPTWLLGDYQGSITDTVGTGTTLTGTATWDPFGTAITAPTGAMATNPLRFHGQFQDSKTSLYDVRLRDYDAAQGRFTGPDPVAASPRAGFAQSYSYGYNNPATYTDPSGACWVCGVVGAVGGAIIGGISGGISAYKSSGGDWGATWEGAGKGAIQGGLSGGAAGLCAGGGIYAMAACAGAGNAAGGYLNSLIWGDDYSWSDAGKDFLWGAGTTLALGFGAKGLGKLFAKTKAVQWVEQNIVRHLPAKLRGQYKCPPTETPGPKTATPKASEVGATVGKSASSNYRETFFGAHPSLRGKVVVHHAIEQQVLKRYPNLFSASEIHSLENLRGIPLAKNNTIHLSEIRRSWNAFYRSHASPTREEVLRHATAVDKQFGSEFLPSR